MIHIHGAASKCFQRFCAVIFNIKTFASSLREKYLLKNDKKSLTNDIKPVILNASKKSFVDEGGTKMNEKRMSILLQTIIVCVALCAIGILAYAVPEMGRAVALHNPDYAHCYWPWVILLWVVSIPGFVGLAYCMLIARDMGRGEAFSERNASRFGITAMLAASDGVLFFGANVVYLF